MRICFVSPYPLGEVSGISTLLIDLAEEFHRRGNTTTFIGPRGPAVTSRMSTVEIPLPARLKTPALARATAAEVGRHAAEWDVLHVHQAHPQTWAAARAARAAGLRVVTTLHLKPMAGRHRLRRLADDRAEKGLLAKSDALVFVSEDTRRRFGGAEGVVIPNGVGREVLVAAGGNRETARQALKVPKGYAFLFAGRQAKIKGYEDVLAAAGQMRTRRDDFSLITAGAQPSGERSGLAPLEARLGQSLRPRGERPRGDWTAFLAADAFLLPSYSEGMPMALLEAMAFSLPPIVTAVGGVPEVVRSGEALFVAPGDRTALVQAMEGLVDDPTKGREIGARARTRLEAFTIARCADRYLGLYGA